MRYPLPHRNAIALSLAAAAALAYCSPAAKRAATTSGKAVSRTELDPLMQRLLVSRDERRAARAEIIALGSTMTEALVSYLDSTEFTLRWEVANILGTTRDPSGVDALVGAVLHDDNPHIRWRSLWALGNMPDPSIPDRFRAALDDPDPTVRWNAAVGGSMFGVQETLPHLQRRLAGGEPFQLWEAVNALGRITDSSSVDVITEFLAGADKKLRRECVLTLGKLLPYPAARIRLIAMLDDDDPGVRWRAAMGLGRVALDEATAVALGARLQVEQDPEVVRYLERSLGKQRR